MEREISRADGVGAGSSQARPAVPGHKPQGRRRIVRRGSAAPESRAPSDHALKTGPVETQVLLAQAAQAAVRSQRPAGGPQLAGASQGGPSREQMEAFWQELLQVLGPNFSGNVVLHCAHGSVMKYEVHQVLRPRGGSVALGEPLDARGGSVVRSSR